MATVISKDGTRIAYNLAGAGPAVILVDGAMGFRGFGGFKPLTGLLEKHFTVYTYDRRGRGESGDTLPYAVEREVEDIEALIDETGGSAFIYGVSSGGSLVIEAGLRLESKIRKLAIYEPPYNSEEGAKKAWNAYINELGKLLALGRRGDAVALFMKLVGAPAEQIEGMRHAPIWPTFEAVGSSLAYDHIGILGETAEVPVDLATRVSLPALVMSGGNSFEFMGVTARALAKAMPQGQYRELEGQTHEVNAEVLAPVMVEFFQSSSAVG